MQSSGFLNFLKNKEKINFCNFYAQKFDVWLLLILFDKTPTFLYLRKKPCPSQREKQGLTVGAPLQWFPRFANATSAQRDNWRLIANGLGVHWEEIDEDLSAEGMFTFQK